MGRTDRSTSEQEIARLADAMSLADLEWARKPVNQGGPRGSWQSLSRQRWLVIAEAAYQVLKGHADA